MDFTTDDINKLKNGEKTALIEHLTQENYLLHGEYDLNDVLEGMPTPSTNQIHVLVLVPEQERWTKTHQIFPTFRPDVEGIILQFPHLSREELVEKLHHKVMMNNLVLLLVPTGSGKTSLMTLLAHQHPELRYFPIQFKINAQEDASNIVASHGVDVV